MATGPRPLPSLISFKNSHRSKRAVCCSRLSARTYWMLIGALQSDVTTYSRGSGSQHHGRQPDAVPEAARRRVRQPFHHSPPPFFIILDRFSHFSRSICEHFSTNVPPYTRRTVCSTWRPCASDAIGDRCLQSADAVPDAVPDSGSSNWSTADG